MLRAVLRAVLRALPEPAAIRSKAAKAAGSSVSAAPAAEPQGQFGNLGGQFGLQGGTQERLLIQIILDTVAKGEWEQSPQAPPQNPNDPPPEPILPVQQRNSIGYYPPARALIVRGTSRYMGAGTMKLKKAEGGQANALPNDPNKGVLVIGPNTPKAPRP